MENLILQRRKMVQDRIEKSFNSGLRISELQAVDINKSLDTDIEKAHNVGDVHPNGKWVWTEIRPGKFDWRVKKNSNNGSGGSTSMANSSSRSGTGNAKSIPASASKPTAQKKFDSDVVEHVDELVKKIGKDKALERFERYVKEYSDDGTKFGAMMKYKYSQAAEYLKGKAESDFKKTFKDARDEVLQQIVSGKIQASADEKKWAKDIIDERKKSEKSAVKIDETTIDQSEYDSQLKIAKQAGDQARSMAKNIIQGNIDETKKKLQETISSRPGAKATIAALQKDLTKFISQKKAVEDAEKEIASGKADKVKKWEEEFSKDALRYLNEDVKYGTIKDRYGEEAEKVAKRILAKRKKERKDFIDSAPHDFTEEQVQTYLSKYNLQSEPSAVVKNKWNTLMGRIGSTSATISVGKGKFKEFSTHDAPDWRPIGDYHYSTMGWDGKYIDINGTIQSWDDVKSALSDTENMTIHIYKHPKQ